MITSLGTISKQKKTLANDLRSMIVKVKELDFQNREL